MAERQAVSPTFHMVGPRVEFGTVHIDHDDATKFRQIGVRQATIRDLQITETGTHIYATSYRTGTLTDTKCDDVEGDSGFFARTVAWAKPDYWRSTLTFSRFSDDDGIDQRIYNIFEVEAHEGELISAVRKVRIFRNLTKVAIDDETGEPVDETYGRERKAFERPLLPEDIDLIAQRAARVMSQQYTRRRRLV